MEDVQEVVETTTEATPSVEETNTVESQEAPVVESNDTDDKHSKTVPYERFKEVNDRLKSLEEKAFRAMEPVKPQYQEPVPELDPDSAKAVDYRAEQKAREIYEAQEARKFEAKHAKDFDKDPLLRASFMLEAQQMMAKGQYVDRELALEQAKAALDARLKPAQEAAKQEGLREGQDIAKTKQQLGAVGETAKVVEKDDSSLSPADYAKKYGIPYTSGY